MIKEGDDWFFAYSRPYIKRICKLYNVKLPWLFWTKEYAKQKIFKALRATRLNKPV